MKFEITVNDCIKFDFLKEVINQNSVEVKVFLESEGIEKNFLTVRTGREKYRFNNFNIFENAEQNSIVFSPIVIGCYSYLKIKSDVPLTLEMVRNGITVTENRVILEAGENRVEFEPRGHQEYVIRIISADIADSKKERRKKRLLNNNSGLESYINVLNHEIKDLKLKKQRLVDDKKRLEKIREEYDKDYALYKADIEEFRSKLTIGEELLKMYEEEGVEVTKIQPLLDEIESGIQKAEEQIRRIIEDKQKKIGEIEKEAL